MPDSANFGCAHETENIVRLGVPEDRSTVRLKENALEFWSGNHRPRISRDFPNVHAYRRGHAIDKVTDIATGGDDGGNVTGADLIGHPQKPNREFPTLQFRFAETMAETPHSYTRRSQANEAEYVRLFNLITEHGVWEGVEGWATLQVLLSRRMEDTGL